MWMPFTSRTSASRATGHAFHACPIAHHRKVAAFLARVADKSAGFGYLNSMKFRIYSRDQSTCVNCFGIYICRVAIDLVW